MNRARVIAMYLPQFHPVKENDEAWGKGFTEWTNVGKAKPLYAGHYQPKIPADLGYYDLRLHEIRVAQAKMAKESGVEGFMYWHYYFGNGKRVLERPFDEVLQSGNPDFPFCLGWANHTWATSTWTKEKRGVKNQIIIEQQYLGKEDYINHFYTVLPAFKDKRYITVDGEPLFVIYAPLAFPELDEFITLWKELSIQNGLKGVHFAGIASGWLENYEKVLKTKCDAIIPANMWNAETLVKGRYRKLIEHMIRKKFPEFLLNTYKYKDIIKHFYTKYDKLDNAYPSIIPQWDRSARSGRKAVIYKGSTPDLFEKHIIDALEIIKDKPDEKKILFLRSWNEWAEGNYVEPDLKFGHAYLNSLKKQILNL